MELVSLVCSMLQLTAVFAGKTCYDSRSGGYSGTMSKTKSGKTCLPWSGTPIGDLLGADKAGVIENYCAMMTWYANGTRVVVPWCFVGDPGGESAEECPIPACGCYYLGGTYRGTLNVTASGKTCRRWDKQPTDHIYSVDVEERLEDGTLTYPDNYCRSGQHSTPWCFTNDDPLVEFCEVPQCAGKHCDCYKAGDTYCGKVSETVSGKKCQRWDEQIPHTHDVDATERLDDGTLAYPENHCRVDGSGDMIPFCYTTDFRTVTDKCPVPACA